MDFCKAFNAQTQSVELRFADSGRYYCLCRSTFTFVTKTRLRLCCRKAAGIAKGSSTPNTVKVAKVNREQLEEIAKMKMPDLTAADMDVRCADHRGYCRASGIDEGVYGKVKQAHARDRGKIDADKAYGIDEAVALLK